MLQLIRKTSSTVWLWVGLIAVVMIGSPVASRVSLAAPQTAAALEPYPEEISVAQAKAKKDEGVFFLDVREPNEWNQAHIPGTTLISLGQLEKRANELPQNKEIVVICRSGGRSATGRDILRKAGFKQVTSMAGGMNAWRAAEYPTVAGP